MNASGDTLARIAELEAEVERRFRELHSLADIALDRGCECEPNGESCPGHAFLELWKFTIDGGGRETEPLSAKPRENAARKERDDG